MPFLKGKASNAIFSVAIAATLSLSAGAIGAQQLSQAQSQATTKASPLMQKLSQVQEKIQQLNGELKAIQTATMENNDGLQAKYGKYQVVLNDTMKENGFNASAVIGRLNAIVEKAQNGEIAQEDQAKLRQEYQKHTQSLQTAQQKAMKVNSVRDAYTTYSESLLTAMKEQNPDTLELIAQLNSAQQQYQTLVQQLQADS